MMDFTKPIQTRDGREAKYLGSMSNGCLAIESWDFGDWFLGAYDLKGAEQCFQQVPPTPPKLTGFCEVNPDGSGFGEVCATLADVENEYEGGWAIDLSTLTEKNFVRVGS